MAEVRPDGGDSGVNALENRFLGLNEVFLNAFCRNDVWENQEEDLFSVSLEETAFRMIVLFLTVTSFPRSHQIRSDFTTCSIPQFAAPSLGKAIFFQQRPAGIILESSSLSPASTTHFRLKMKTQPFHCWSIVSMGFAKRS